MKTINIVIGRSAPGIVLGRRGENEATEVVFDVSALIALYGDGNVVLLAKRPGDESAYPVPAVRDGNTLTWTVTDADTSVRGSGECELFWYVGDVLAKSVVYRTAVGRDIGETTEDPPDAYETWVESLTSLGVDAEQSAQDAAQSAADASDYAEAARQAADEAAGYTFPSFEFSDDGDGNITISEVEVNG